MKKREMAENAREFVLKCMYIVNSVLILCHIGIAFFYDYYNMDILFYINIGFIAVCLLAFICLKKRMLTEYVHFMFYELYAFMIVSIIFLGWELGFQHYCLSFTVAIFFCDFYLNKTKSVSRKTVVMGAFNLLLYLGLRIWTYYYPYVYSCGNEKVERGIFIANSVLTFYFIIMYMFIYSNAVTKLENELRYTAERDPLTGLYNRRKMIQRLTAAIESPKSGKLAVAMFDVDFFKNINDTYGHDAGDEVLKKLAEILGKHNSDNDRYAVCRWGGEEFLAMYIHDSPREKVIEEFEAVRREIENAEILYEDKKIRITITIGLAFCTEGASFEELLRKVDLLLYEGKEAGRNRVSFE